MKKKIVIFLIITAVVISAGIGAYAAAEKAAYRQKVERSADLLNTAITEVTQNHSVTESGVRGMLVDDTSQFDLASYLRGKGYYEDEVVTILQKYIDATTLYGLTQAESDYLVSLCDLGYDFEKLLDIYQFLQITQDRDIALVKPMYEAARGTFDSKFWLENAYSLIKGWDENTLSMEEIMKYTDQGIGIEEIVYAFQLSLLGNSTERDILNARLQGQSWAGLSAAACNDVALADKVAALSLEDTITCIEVSHMLEKKPSEILETGSTLQLKTEAATELSNKRQIKSTLTNEFCDFAAPLAEAKQEIPQIDEATLQDMLKSGYRIRDIKAVVQGEATVTESQINIKQIIESERDGGEAQ